MYRTNIVILSSLLVLSLGACSSDNNTNDDPDGGVDQKVDTAKPDDTSSGNDQSEQDASPDDQKASDDQNSADCDLGVPPWTGGLGQGQEDALFEFESADRKTAVKFVRTYVEWGIGESAIYANEGFSIQSDEHRVCITDKASLDYTNSHHNWRDQAVSKVGQTTYLLDLYFDVMNQPEPKWIFTVSAVEDEKTVWGPIDLIKLSGPERQ